MSKFGTSLRLLFFSLVVHTMFPQSKDLQQQIKPQEHAQTKSDAITHPSIRKNENKAVFQQDMRVGWVVMLTYWAVGGMVGYLEGYYDLLLKPQPMGVLHVIAAIVTLIARAALNPRYGSFGRKRELGAIFIYSVLNGVFETFLFLFTYDLGRHVLMEIVLGRHDKAVDCIIGFSLYYIYAALIHIVVWQRLVFPEHSMGSAPPFLTHGLPFLTILSISWLVLYEQSHDVAFLCLLHMLTDFGMTLKCSMPYTRWDAHGKFLR